MKILDMPLSLFSSRISREFYPGDMHEIEVISSDRRKDGSVIGTYNYYFYGTYQSTHDFIFERGELTTL